MFDVVVVGGGHAGVEAAAAAARVGVQVALVVPRREQLARLSCNPAIGGTAKGQLAREVDALGGLMALAADRSAIQYRMLNRSKGPAVWSPRAQVDRELYPAAIDRMLLEGYPEIEIVEGEVVALQTSGGRLSGVTLADGASLRCRSAVLCAGTFLRGLTHTGSVQRDEGRRGEAPARALAESLDSLGFPRVRFKTGTPPRVVASSVELDAMEAQRSDEEAWTFSHHCDSPRLPQRACYRAHTSPESHRIIADNIARAPLFNGTIRSTGPRYCPSIEDKVMRFPERQHQALVFEPEGLDSPLLYVNGFSSSLPEETQLEALRRVPGCEFVEIALPGYAVEYDVVPPASLRRTLESKQVEGLYLAGQINGTSGYEEAAMQGLLAGANAALAQGGREAIVLRRDEAYGGVLVDDLITLLPNEPYRMFTSRAEYRLLLRQDNAEERLHQTAYRSGLIDETRYETIKARAELVERSVRRLSSLRLAAPRAGQSPPSQGRQEGSKVETLLQRGEASLALVLSWAKDQLQDDLDLGSLDNPNTRRQVDIELRYRGYLERERKQARRLAENENASLALDLDYHSIPALSAEARQKLDTIRPETLGQASRIDGVRASDLALLLVYLRKARGQELSRGSAKPLKKAGEGPSFPPKQQAGRHDRAKA